MQEIKVKPSTLRAIEALVSSQEVASSRVAIQLLDTLVCIEALSSPGLKQDLIEEIFDRSTIQKARLTLQRRTNAQMGSHEVAAIQFIAREANRFGLQGRELGNTVLGHELMGAFVQYVELLREGMSETAADEAFWHRFRAGAGTDERGRR